MDIAYHSNSRRPTTSKDSKCMYKAKKKKRGGNGIRYRIDVRVANQTILALTAPKTIDKCKEREKVPGKESNADR